MAAHFDEARVRALLMAEHARLSASIANLKTGDQAAFPDAPEDDLDDVRGDEVEQAEPLTDAERNQDVYDQLSIELAKVERALKRLDDGTFGQYLIRNGKPIDPERLISHPWLLYDMDVESDPPATTPKQDDH